MDPKSWSRASISRLPASSLSSALSASSSRPGVRRLQPVNFVRPRSPVSSPSPCCLRFTSSRTLCRCVAHNPDLKSTKPSRRTRACCWLREQKAGALCPGLFVKSYARRLRRSPVRRGTTRAVRLHRLPDRGSAAADHRAGECAVVAAADRPANAGTERGVRTEQQ